MWIGGYTLDLYCDKLAAVGFDEKHGFKSFPRQFVAELGSTCRRQARDEGWILGRDGSAICPKCSGKKPRGKK